jgi:hypothetical protein
MKTKFYILISFVFLLLVIVNCKHKLPEPTEPPVTSTTSTTTTGGTTGPVDTVRNFMDSVCFSEKIYPLLISNCAKSGCHNDSAARAGVVLMDYPRVISTISGNLLLQVVQDTGKLQATCSYRWCRTQENSACRRRLKKNSPPPR